MLFPAISFAQTASQGNNPDGVIKGNVVSVNGEPLKGVLINEKNTTIFHLSKENGEFQRKPYSWLPSLVEVWEQLWE